MKTFTQISILSLLLFIGVSLSPAQVTYNGRSIFTGSATVSACGTSPVMSTANSLNSGTVTVGAGAVSINNNGNQQVQPVTNCTVTSSAAFTNPQTVIISPWVKNVSYTIKVVSSTVFTVSFSTDMAGQKFSFLTF